MVTARRMSILTPVMRRSVHSARCTYGHVPNLNFSVSHAWLWTRVWWNFYRTPRLNMDRCEVIDCKFHHMSIWTCVRLILVLYYPLQYGHVFWHKFGQRGIVPDTCHKRTPTEPNLWKWTRVRRILIPTLATQLGYVSDERFYSIPSVKLNSYEVNSCTVWNDKKVQQKFSSLTEWFIRTPGREAADIVWH